MKILFAWIGNADLRGSDESSKDSGPIANVLDNRNYDEVVLLCNQPKNKGEAFSKWIRKKVKTPIDIKYISLKSPIDIGEIWPTVVQVVDEKIEEVGEDAELTFHISPGTPSMAVVWIILGKTKYPATLVQSSVEHGVQDANIPFDISAELLPAFLTNSDKALRSRSAEGADKESQFGDIVYRSDEMRRLIDRAKKAAVRSIPVLIEGESGTGKELLATAIYNASQRKDKPFRVVNCGAISAELVESELFGHKKGAFTGATADKIGFFEQSNGGTLFLDEIGELPLPAQVKLLRVLQEGQVTPVGSTELRKVDVRIIAATNRNLIEEVAKGRFREDLFYRLAVLDLKVPSLRERQGELGLLIDALLNRVNEECRKDLGSADKKLSPGARRVLLNHSWPGNVRELQNTLRRAFVWCDESTISEKEMKESLLPYAVPAASNNSQLAHIGEGVDLNKIIGDVAKEYLQAADKTAGGNKSKAAKLLNLNSHQVFSKWWNKYVTAKK